MAGGNSSSRVVVKMEKSEGTTRRNEYITTLRDVLYCTINRGVVD